MTTPALKPGARVWRMGRVGPLGCVFLRTVPGGRVEVRSSTFSRETIILNAELVFADRNACRAEIQRRAQATEGAKQ